MRKRILSIWTVISPVLYESDDQGFNENSLVVSSSPDSILITIQTTGSVLGKTNSVHNSINNYEELIKQENEEKTNSKSECVLYVTSMGINRQTFQNCKKLKAILDQHFIRFDERDISKNPCYRAELEEKLKGQSDVPILFVDGKSLGSIEALEDLNECGQLSHLLAKYKMTTNTIKS